MLELQKADENAAAFLYNNSREKNLANPNQRFSGGNPSFLAFQTKLSFFSPKIFKKNRPFFSKLKKIRTSISIKNFTADRMGELSASENHSKALLNKKKKKINRSVAT